MFAHVRLGTADVHYCELPVMKLQLFGSTFTFTNNITPCVKVSERGGAVDISKLVWSSVSSNAGSIINPRACALPLQILLRKLVEVPKRGAAGQGGAQVTCR